MTWAGSAALGQSQSDFTTVVWPAVQDVCGGGTLVPVESVAQTEFAKQLDMLSGIDAWQVLPYGSVGEVMRGIACRVQQGPKGWDTFTVRRSVKKGRPTEWHKRVAAMDGHGILTPHLVIQGYVSDGSLVSAGVAKMSDVIAAIHPDSTLWRVNPQDGSTFWVVPFGDVPGCVTVSKGAPR